MLVVQRNLSTLQHMCQSHPTDLRALVESGELARIVSNKETSSIASPPVQEKTRMFHWPKSQPQAPSTPTTETATFKAPASVSSLQDDVEAMQLFKFDPVLERQARVWIEEVTQTKFPEGVSFAVALKSGVILCTLINCIKPGSIARVNTKDVAYQQMENIQAYLKACSALGLHNSDLFQTVDLFENKNLNVVGVSFFLLSLTHSPLRANLLFILDRLSITSMCWGSTCPK